MIGISAGNHAQALAYGAALEGIPSLVVMWQSASPRRSRRRVRTARRST